MAFPGDYTKYQEIVIDNTKVSADLTDYPCYVDLSNLSKAGSDIFDTCRSDGGDIRITKSDGTTQLPREVVFIDTTAKTGELHFKFTGTLSSSSDTTVRIWYNGVDTEPAADSTYGSEAVWSDYEVVHHMQQDPSGSAPQMLDSTANDQHGSSAGSMTTGDSVDGKLSGKALQFDGSDDEIAIADSVILGNVFDSYGTAWSYQSWFKDDNGTNQNLYNGKGGPPSLFTGGLSGTVPNIHFRQNATQEDRITGSTDITNQTWHHVVFQNTTSYAANDFQFFVDGSQDTTSNSDDGMTAAGSPANSNPWYYGSDGVTHTEGTQDEVRIRLGNLSGSWWATEYNNHNSPSTFYSTSDEFGGAVRRIFSIT